MYVQAFKRRFIGRLKEHRFGRRGGDSHQHRISVGRVAMQFELPDYEVISTEAAMDAV